MFAFEQQSAREASGLAGNEQRRAQIVDLVRRQGFVSIDSLAQRFAVTPQTVRRDINALCEQAVLQRHHGGAALASSVENIAYLDRQVLCIEEKRRIAQLVAAHIPDHASLFINIGTTTEEIAKQLLRHVGLRVITNNLNVAALLAQQGRLPGDRGGRRGPRARPRHRRRGGHRPDPPVPRRFRRDRHQRHRPGRHPARLRLPGGAGRAGDHRQLAPGVPRRRPHQVRPQRHGPAGRARGHRRAVHRHRRRRRRCSSGSRPPRWRCSWPMPSR